MRQRWRGLHGSLERWEALKEEVEVEAAALEAGGGGARKQSGGGGGEGVRGAKSMRKSLKDIVCAYAYPRLDMEVSKKMNHLLKVCRAWGPGGGGGGGQWGTVGDSGAAGRLCAFRW